MRTRYVLFVVGLMAVTLISGVSIATRMADQPQETLFTSDAVEPDVKDRDVFAPELNFEFPTVFTEGESVGVYLRVIDPDTPIEEVVYEIENAPAWMQIDGPRLYGTPEIYQNNVQSFELVLSDGKNVNKQKIYFYVEESPN